MENRLFFLINMAQHSVFQSTNDQALDRLGITVTQVAGLLYLSKHDGCIQSDLGDALRLNKSAASGLAKRLERDGLVTRRACEFDGRAFRLGLTAKAKRILPKVKPLLAQLNRKLTAGFSPKELQVVSRFLSTTLERFER